MKLETVQRGSALVVAFFVALFFFGQAAFADGEAEHPPGKSNMGAHSDKNAARIDTGKTPPVQKAGRSGKTDPIGDFDLARYQYCGKDSDCVASINGCCDCANGGIEVAVNAERLEDFRKNFECLYVACGENEPDMPCGSGVVSCVNHKCKYFPSKDAPQAGKEATEKM